MFAIVFILYGILVIVVTINNWGTKKLLERANSIIYDADKSHLESRRDFARIEKIVNPEGDV